MVSNGAVKWGRQMNKFVVLSDFNFANMTCKMVELCRYHWPRDGGMYLYIDLIKPIPTTWHVKFAKLKPLWSISLRASITARTHMATTFANLCKKTMMTRILKLLQFLGQDTYKNERCKAVIKCKKSINIWKTCFDNLFDENNQNQHHHF